MKNSAENTRARAASGAARRKLLLVDDERNIVVSLSAVLQLHGFEVTTATNVADALQLISRQAFDILVADLNVGEPGDGFTIVSALRRTHPAALAVILTGFPAFDVALEAIRKQADDFLLKPIPPAELVSAIERLALTRSKHESVPVKPLYQIVRESRDSILQQWMEKMTAYTQQIGRSDLTGEQLRDHLPGLIEELCVRVEQHATTTTPEAQDRAMQHGRLRRQQALDPNFLLVESSAVRQSVLAAVHRRLLNINLSSLFLDLSLMSDSLDEQLQIAMKALIDKCE